MNEYKNVTKNHFVPCYNRSLHGQLSNDLNTPLLNKMTCSSCVLSCMRSLNSKLQLITAAAAPQVVPCLLGVVLHQISYPHRYLLATASTERLWLLSCKKQDPIFIVWFSPFCHLAINIELVLQRHHFQAVHIKQRKIASQKQTKDRRTFGVECSRAFTPTAGIQDNHLQYFTKTLIWDVTASQRKSFFCCPLGMKVGTSIASLWFKIGKQLMCFDGFSLSLSIKH